MAETVTIPRAHLDKLLAACSDLSAYYAQRNLNFRMQRELDAAWQRVHMDTLKLEPVAK